MKNELREISYIRVIAITSIVVWHCSICPLLYWELFDVDELPIKWPLKMIAYLFFPDAVMPLFTFIAGYLFCYLLSIGKYKDFKAFVTNKLNRLIVPFIIVGTIVNITSYDRYLSSIPWGEGSHLWYCCMLFWCFVITWFIKERLLLLYSLLFISFCLEIIIQDHFDMGFKLLLGIHQSLYYIGYFIFGFLLFQNQKIIYQIKKYYLFWAFLYFLTGIFRSLDVLFVSRLAVIFHNYLFSVLLVAFFIEKKVGNSKMNNLIATVCKYGFGIYVFHEWISWNFCHIPVVVELIKNHYLIFPIVNFVWIFIVSYILTEQSLKTKVGRYLLL